MQRNVVLKENVLFDGFSESEIGRLLFDIGAVDTKYRQKKTLIKEGGENPFVFVLLEGSGYGIRYDIDGNPQMYTKLMPGAVIGDVLAVSGQNLSPVTVQVEGGSHVLRFEYARVLKGSAETTGLRMRLMANLSFEIAQKFFELHRQADCLTRPSIREKILTFLENEASRQKSNIFAIPMDREKMAVYLNTDRSALSRELSKLKKEGIIDYYKNSFVLIGVKR